MPPSARAYSVFSCLPFSASEVGGDSGGSANLVRLASLNGCTTASARSDEKKRYSDPEPKTIPSACSLGVTMSCPSCQPRGPAHRQHLRRFEAAVAFHFADRAVGDIRKRLAIFGGLGDASAGAGFRTASRFPRRRRSYLVARPFPTRGRPPRLRRAAGSVVNEPSALLAVPCAFVDHHPVVVGRAGQHRHSFATVPQPGFDTLVAEGREQARRRLLHLRHLLARRRTARARRGAIFEVIARFAPRRCRSAPATTLIRRSLHER